MKDSSPNLTEGYLYVRCTYCELPMLLCFNIGTLQYLSFCPKCQVVQTIVPPKAEDLIPKPGPRPGKRKH